MFDTFTKYLNGIIVRHTKDFGNFDKYYYLHSIISNKKENNVTKVIRYYYFYSNYCLVNFKYQKKGLPIIDNILQS